MTCSICLEEVPDAVIECQNRHCLHVQCFAAMVKQMHRFTCPYCAAPINVNINRPSALVRTLVVAEHTIYAFILWVSCVFNKNDAPLLAMNNQLCRLRCQHTIMDSMDESVKHFRIMMAYNILCAVPMSLFITRKIQTPLQWSRIDLVELIACLSIISR